MLGVGVGLRDVGGMWVETRCGRCLSLLLYFYMSRTVSTRSKNAEGSPLVNVYVPFVMKTA